MFVKNKIIDKNKIQSVIENRKLLTYDSLKKDWDDVCEISKKMGIEQNGSCEFNFYELYDVSFSTSLLNLSIDELEFINDNNLFEFDENNILDYRCKISINKKINNYKLTLNNLVNSMQKGDIESYFQEFGDLFKMSVQGTKITIILGLDRENVELTPEGEKLKACIDNIKKLFITSRTQRVNPNSIKSK